MKLLIFILWGIILPMSLHAFQKNTQKDTSQVEWIKAYFNEKSDHNYAFENNKSNDLADMIGVLVEQIDQAKYSVDLAAYDLQNIRIGAALARAKRRGLRVRVITDIIHREHSPRFNTPMWDTLRSAGIVSFDDSGTIYWPMGNIESLPKKLPNSGANMHHKFAVIDALSKDPDDMYLWTGTMNITYTGPWNTNSTILIKDSGITLTYEEEFNQMWGNTDRNVPTPQNARFHKDKKNVSENIFWVNNTKVEVYFGPQNRKNTKPSISKRITELISDYAKSDIHFIAFAISSNIPLSQAMIKRSDNAEILVKGVIDPAFYSRYRNLNDIWASEESRSDFRMILPGKEVRKLHAKTLLIDAAYKYPEEHTAITITGSYNFSKAAEEANDENILFIHSNEITNQYFQDFMGVYNRANGVTEHRFPDFDTEEWFSYIRPNDSQSIKVEFLTNFPYPVSMLGVKSPRSWAGHKDSTHYFAEEAAKKLKELTKGKKVRIVGPNGELPMHRYGKYHGYILADDGNEIIHVNREMIRLGYAQYAEFYKQHPDSVAAFQALEAEAKKNNWGMWENEHMIEEVVLTEKAKERENIFPLNINSATATQLEHLPGIGPGKAKAIVEHRETNGYFRAPIDLTEIRGFGAETIKKIKPFLIFEIPENH